MDKLKRISLIVFQTNNSWEPFILRVSLGLVILAHGLQKLLGWFGGYGISGTMNYFTTAVGLPWILGFFIILLESFGALCLILGIGTRVIAASLVMLALGIIFSSHIQNGFFMNWYGNQPGEGVEYFLLWIGMAIGLSIAGGGKFSIDRFSAMIIGRVG
ncbi:MAG: hypothetical protein DHS20C17_20360 [Cyclobacteriaceae bacterium]|nr:MAG: hypothetical protein DHS20C17_20360 [Cyclobacteriaceae bacterium]